MELDEIKNMNIDPEKINENFGDITYKDNWEEETGEKTPEIQLFQLIKSNCLFKKEGRRSYLYGWDGRGLLEYPKGEKYIDKFVKSYFSSFYDDYIITKKEIVSWVRKNQEYLFTDKYYLGECCHYSLCLTLGLQDYYKLNDWVGHEEIIYPEWRKRFLSELDTINPCLN